MFDKRSTIRLDGIIAGCGFSSGDRFVAGIWKSGPLGPMNDLMWAQPDGRKVLLVPDPEVGTFVGGIYSFDEVRVVPFDLVTSTSHRLHLRAGPVELDLFAVPGPRIFRLRPKWLRRTRTWVRVEDRLLRPIVGRFVLQGAAGVRGYGTSPSGVREWYAIDHVNPVVWGDASIDGRDLGALGPVLPPVRFGFSEFPEKPALVRCAPILDGARPYLPKSS
ncbi:MAG: hypothetical protein M3198_00820 [Actinomycetota bacterium]|nr:hypothetical protein [Actinomycetota bacterium]